MATVGLSKPYYAMYANNGGTVTYSGLAVLGKAVELSVDLDGGDANVLYADNAAAESVSTFAGGSLTITTDDLLLKPAAAILGLTETDITTPAGSEMVFKADQTVPYVGFGVVVKKIQSNATKWLAVVFPKVQFQNPGLTAVTQGETIDWQTPELTANILRDDTQDAVWQRWALLDTEADAEAYIKSKFGTTAGT